MAGIQNNQLWFSAIFHIFDVYIKFGILCQLKDNFAYFSIKHKLKGSLEALLTSNFNIFLWRIDKNILQFSPNSNLKALFFFNTWFTDFFSKY